MYRLSQPNAYLVTSAQALPSGRLPMHECSVGSRHHVCLSPAAERWACLAEDVARLAEEGVGGAARRGRGQNLRDAAVLVLDEAEEATALHRLALPSGMLDNARGGEHRSSDKGLGRLGAARAASSDGAGGDGAGGRHDEGRARGDEKQKHESDRAARNKRAR